MKILAKMKCERVEKLEASGCDQVSLRAVYEADGQGNKSWSAATPAGQASLTISNPTARGAFEEGKFYLLTFEPYEEAVVSSATPWIDEGG